MISKFPVDKKLKFKSTNYRTQNTLYNELGDPEQNSEETFKKQMC